MVIDFSKVFNPQPRKFCPHKFAVPGLAIEIDLQMQFSGNLPSGQEENFSGRSQKV